jgi:hypothetical protein
MELNLTEKLNGVVKSYSVKETEERRKMKRYLCYLMILTIMLSVTFVSCEKVWMLKLNKTSAILAVNSTLTLNVEVLPDDAINKKIIWTSDNPSVATVKSGVVSGIADGIAVITATTKDGKCRESCTIAVTSKTIYTVSYDAKLWKNGELQDFKDAKDVSYIHSIFVSNNDDIYVIGKLDNETAGFWKNGITQNVEDNMGIALGDVSSVFVSGNDVYAAGQSVIQGQGNMLARLWKNGIMQNLENADYKGQAYSVFVSENDVYVVGESHGVARLWKNGVLQNLGDEDNSYYTSVFVYGNDVYVTGQVYDAARLWKNGVVQNLTDGNSDAFARSVFVSGNDVYVAGTVDGMVTLWKNGIKQDLENSSYCLSPSVFVFGSNVYVCGSQKLWINGRSCKVDGDYIFVK